jgi:hypothetical protein
MDPRVTRFLLLTLEGHDRRAAVRLAGVPPALLNRWLAKGRNRARYEEARATGVAMHPEVGLYDAFDRVATRDDMPVVRDRPAPPRNCQVFDRDGARCQRVTKRGSDICRWHEADRHWEDVLAGRAQPPSGVTLRERCRESSSGKPHCGQPVIRWFHVIITGRPQGDLHVYPDWCRRHSDDEKYRKSEIDRLTAPSADEAICEACTHRFAFVASRAPAMCPECACEADRRAWAASNDE